MTDERTPSFMLGQCQQLACEAVRELERAMEIGIKSQFFLARIEEALYKAKRIRDIHEEEGR